MEFKVDESKVIPPQSLEDKAGHVAKIVKVFACDRDGGALATYVEPHRAEFVRVQIRNKTGGGRSAGQVFAQEEYLQFFNTYSVKHPEDLLGKPTISVYTTIEPTTLTGLIPLNMDR
ncbi:hypothetical protein ACFL1B_01165 [Nanoarchaeota archaeon]